MEDQALYNVESLEAAESNFKIDQIASLGNEWFLIHYLDEGAQSIYPVAVWAIHNGDVIGLISVKHKDSRLVGPPSGMVEYKTRDELSDEQIEACNAGKVFKE